MTNPKVKGVLILDKNQAVVESTFDQENEKLKSELNSLQIKLDQTFSEKDELLVRCRNSEMDFEKKIWFWCTGA